MGSVAGILAGLFCGAALGWLHFQGLWLTVERLPALRHPGAWIAVSFGARALLLAAALVLLVHYAGWAALAAALAALIVVRAVLVRRLGPPRASRGEP